MARQWTDEQRAEFGKTMKAKRDAKKTQTKTEEVPQNKTVNTAVNTVEIDETTLKNLVARLEAFEKSTPPPVNQHLNAPQTIQIGQMGQTLGVVTKYPIDPGYYPNPVEDLYDEPQLQRFAIRDNWIFKWEVDGQTYETKFGTNVREPFFKLTMYRRDFDEDGNPKDNAFRVRRLFLNEDETVTYQIAQELGIDVDNISVRDLMDIARYERIRQWILDYFFPKKISAVENNTTEMVDPLSGRVIPVENISKLL